MIPTHLFACSNYHPLHLQNPFFYTYIPSFYHSNVYPIPIPTSISPSSENFKQFADSKTKEKHPKRGSGRNMERIEKRSSDHDEYKTKQQNSERNIMSNISHHLMGYLRRSQKIRPILEQVIQRHRLEITCQEFFKIIAKIRLKNYVRMTILKEHWTEKPNDKGFSKALRVMGHYFLTQKYFLWIQSSKKIKGVVKSQHMSKRRVFAQILKSGQ